VISWGGGNIHTIKCKADGSGTDLAVSEGVGRNAASDGACCNSNKTSGGALILTTTSRCDDNVAVVQISGGEALTRDDGLSSRGSCGLTSTRTCDNGGSNVASRVRLSGGHSLAE
jgi:hypothetical protein